MAHDRVSVLQALQTQGVCPVFYHPDAEVRTATPVQGLICSDSHGAPGFSEWKHCDELAGGIEQMEDVVEITIGDAAP